MKTLDLIVIGAGPAGLSAAVEAQRGGLKDVLVLEKGPSHSQMIRTFYKEGKRVDARYAGQEALCFGLLCLRDGDRESFLGLMDHVISSYQLQIEYQTEVWSILKDNSTGAFEVKTSQGSRHAKTVIVAIGRMGRPNQPDYYSKIPPALKNDKRILFDITSQNISGEKVLVVGGGDSAAEYCDMLSVSNEVTLSYRRGEFTKMNPLNKKILEELISSQKIQTRMPSTITAVQESHERPEVIYGETDHLPEVFDRVVYALGGMNPTSFLQASRVDLTEKGEALVNLQHESSVEGLYIAGDLLGKGRGGGSIIAGFNSAAEAVRDLLLKHFHHALEPELVTLDHLNF